MTRFNLLNQPERYVVYNPETGDIIQGGTNGYQGPKLYMKGYAQRIANEHNAWVDLYSKPFDEASYIETRTWLKNYPQSTRDSHLATARRNHEVSASIYKTKVRIKAVHIVPMQNALEQKLSQYVKEEDLEKLMHLLGPYLK